MTEFNSYQNTAYLAHVDPNEIIGIRTLQSSIPTLETMARLRHFGFPSPLLDWTRSPYIAAYFACSDQSHEDASIYAYMECSGNGKVGWAEEPRINSIGRTITTGERHHIQQCEYTICTRPADQDRFKGHDEFANHEDVFARKDKYQDHLVKFILPSPERPKILANLQEMNINSYTLFRSEESLCQMLASSYLN